MSFLDYYAFIFIASELDTWEYLGGTTSFNKAIELASLGKDSDWSNGWDDRWKKSRKLKDNQYLRSMRFHHFSAQDALFSEEININIVKKFCNNTFGIELLPINNSSTKIIINMIKTIGINV